MNVSTSISTSLTSNLYGDYLVGGQPNEQRTIDIVLVDIYDLVLDRCLKYEEYKKEWQEVIEHHKKMGCI